MLEDNWNKFLVGLKLIAWQSIDPNLMLFNFKRGKIGRCLVPNLKSNENHVTNEE